MRERQTGERWGKVFCEEIPEGRQIRNKRRADEDEWTDGDTQSLLQWRTEGLSRSSKVKRKE